jgi:probable rRNA maturation factor
MSSDAREAPVRAEVSPEDSDEPPSPQPSGPASPVVLTADERSDATRADPVIDLDGLAGLLSRVLRAEGVPGDAEASLTLVDPERIAELKLQYLEGDGSPTDVLSFPIDGADGDPEGWVVGDVVLCPRVAADQAPDHAGTLEDELALLVVHSGLHLVGWDHSDDPERERMWARERDLMTELHRAPARDPWDVSG